RRAASIPGPLAAAPAPYRVQGEMRRAKLPNRVPFSGSNSVGGAGPGTAPPPCSHPGSRLAVRISTVTDPLTTSVNQSLLTPPLATETGTPPGSAGSTSRQATSVE